MIRVLILRIVLASIGVAGAANLLAKVHLGVRLPRPEGFIIGRGWPKIYKGLGNSMPRSYTRQATRLFLLAPGSHRVGRGNYPITLEAALRKK